MNAQEKPARGRIAPSLLVRDLAETVAFYGTLGFELTAAYPDVERPPGRKCPVIRPSFQCFTRPPTGTADIPQSSGLIYVHVNNIERVTPSAEPRGC